MKEFKNKTDKELKKLLLDKRNALQTFRFALSGSNVRNTKEGYFLKKDIARILTFLNKKDKTK